MMKLSQLVTNLNIAINPNEQWAITGPEAGAFAVKLTQGRNGLSPFNRQLASSLDGLILAGALSDIEAAETWLADLAAELPANITLIIVDWQADGPLDIGPDLNRRVKQGRARRLLREAGFGLIDELASQPMYYIIHAQKAPAPLDPQAGHYIAVAHVDELPKNVMKTTELFGHKIIVANTGREIVAFSAVCPHAAGPVDKGLLRGRNVVCPTHGYIWNVCTGEPVQPDDEDTLRRYPVKVDADSGQVLVALAALC